MIKKKKEVLEKYIGKILLNGNGIYKWMYKLVGVVNDEFIEITQGMDIFPEPRAYKHGPTKQFNNVDYEDLYNAKELREPTKEELNLYRKYSRELILLGTNKTNYGNKNNKRT